jgi:undecaprenyl-diphosphatase
LTLELRRARAVLVASAALFLALALAALLLPTPAIEVALREALLRLDAGVGAGFWRMVDNAGTWRVILPGALVLFALSREARARWWIWAVALLAAPGAETLFKFAIGRTRPEALTMGFPSGHATAAAAFFGGVIYLAGCLPRRTRRCVQALAVACILLVSVSRVALGAHWPTDALAGMALGIALASAARLLAWPPARPAAPGPRRPLP